VSQTEQPSRRRPVYMAFDLLYRDGRDLSARPLANRRVRLEGVVAGSELVFQVGVTREYIARLETGKHDPPLSRIEKLAKALNVKVGRLLQ